MANRIGVWMHHGGARTNTERAGFRRATLSRDCAESVDRLDARRVFRRLVAEPALDSEPERRARAHPAAAGRA
jgi:hypothetical protein